MSAADRLDRIEARAQAAADQPYVRGDVIAATAADVPVLVAAVRAVLDRHRRDGSEVAGWCLHDGRPWPCPTVQAVTEALGGERAMTWPTEPVECCASGRCEVCTPGYDWGRDG